MKFGNIVLILMLMSTGFSFAKNSPEKGRKPNAAQSITINGKQAESLFKLVQKVDSTSSECKMDECVGSARIVCSSNFEHTTYSCRFDAEQ